MQCTSRPDCGCSFCVHTRKDISPRDEQDRAALEFMAQLEAKAARIRAQRIRATYQSKRNEPIYHRHHGRLCDACHFHKKKG